MKRLFISLSLAAAVMAGCCSNEPKTSENSTVETIMARRSIRQYTEEAVSREALQALAECGVNAPNAMNRQDWAIRVVDSKEYIDGVSAAMTEGMPARPGAEGEAPRNQFRNATAVIFVAAPSEDPTRMYGINVGLLCENICLAAQSMGLGTCVMAAPTMMMKRSPACQPFIEKLALPEGYELYVCVAVGHPAETPDAKPRDLTKIQFID